MSLEVCDDCRQPYPGPAYYTFEGCELTETDANGDTTVIPHGCTGNMCPDCAGPYLDPDIDGDPRRPPEILRYVLIQECDKEASGPNHIGQTTWYPKANVIESWWLPTAPFSLKPYSSSLSHHVRITLIESEDDLTNQLTRWRGLPLGSLIDFKEVT